MAIKLQEVNFENSDLVSKEKPLCIALGFFGSVHIGHQKIFSQTINTAKKLGAVPAIATLLYEHDEPNSILFTYQERLQIYSSYKCDQKKFPLLIAIPFTEEFKNLSPEEFIDKLTTHFNVAGLVSGKSYRFGKDAKGTPKKLEGIAAKKKIFYYDMVTRKIDGRTISTSYIKVLIKNGNLIVANKELGFNYFITGEVIKGAGRGNELGFPTANIMPVKEKILLPDGVYHTATMIGKKKYPSITSIGTKPTFDDETKSVETHIIGISEKLYGKDIKVSFIKKIRDVIKFGSKEELIEQIKKDIAIIPVK